MKQNLKSTFAIDVLIFAVLLGMMLMEPSMDFGRSLNLNGLLIHLGTVVIAVALSVASIHALLFLLGLKTDSMSFIRLGGYGMVTLLVAMLVTSYAFKLARTDEVLTEDIATQKIEHFCYAKFKHDLCLIMVNNYPRAALRIEKWKRDVMAERLKYYRHFYPQSYLASHKIDLKARAPSGKR